MKNARKELIDQLMGIASLVNLHARHVKEERIWIVYHALLMDFQRCQPYQKLKESAYKMIALVLSI